MSYYLFTTKNYAWIKCQICANILKTASDELQMFAGLLFCAMGEQDMQMKKAMWMTLSVMCLATAGLVASSGAPQSRVAAEETSQQPLACSLMTLKGAYGFKFEGTILLPPPEKRLNAVALVTFDGAGTFAGSEVGRRDGVPLPTTFSGTYTVSSNCAGTLDLSQVFGATGSVQAAFTIVERGRELFLVVDSPATQIGGVAERVGGHGDRSR